jgi:glyoxylase-like metal-dependent hydrolase (beta-lactamase superfamily II)
MVFMIARRSGDVRIHTFVAPFTGSNIANATHIIESPNALVLFDAQFLVPYARQFREYADSLGKPIDRIYVSHRHPDHWLGLGAAFADVPVHALAETATFIQEHGAESRDDHWKLGSLVAEQIVVPHEIVKPGESVVDGVRYQFEEITDTEIDSLLVVKLPDLGVQFVADLVYSGTHLYLTSHLRNWSRVLQDMLLSDYDLFMPGHGLPADRNEVARNFEYLSAAGEAIGSGLTGEAFSAFLQHRYPERKCPGIFDIYLPRLFGDARSY